MKYYKAASFARVNFEFAVVFIFLKHLCFLSQNSIIYDAIKILSHKVVARTTVYSR